MTVGSDGGLGRYLSELHMALLSDPAAPGWREFDGTLVFADISGFTPLTERLSRQGKIGAELLTGALTKVFTELLRAAGEYGGDCLKFGGDALMLLFDGPDHARRAVAGADAVREALRVVRRQREDGGPNLSRLNMSLGVHTGTVHAFLVGTSHKELVVTGPAITGALRLEGLARAGEVLVSATTAAALDEKTYEPVEPGAFRLLKPPVAARTDRAGPVDRSSVASGGLCEVLRDYLPTAPEDGEHRLAAVSFINFGGVDAALLSDGAAAMYERLQQLVGRVEEVVSRHGVTYLDTDVNKDGGKIYVTAGAPQSSGDDEDRLLQAIAAVLDGSTAPSPLRLRAGVNRGRVFALNLGSPWRRTYTVMGDTVNLAARVMGRAEWGQALATTAVTDRTRVDFHVEPIPPFMVKGKSEPISAAIVHEPRGTREIQTAETTRVVGREDELAQIDSAIDSAFQGSGRVVTIVGPPGIGKSKLVLEAMNKAEGMLRIRCDGGRYSLATPYFALRRPILAGLGLTMEASQGVVEATLREVVASVAPELLPLLPLLAGTVGIEIEDTPRTANLTGAERHEEVNRSLAHYIRRTLTGPSLIVIEDAHWVDTASAEVLTELCADLAGRPWAVVLTRRPEPGGFLAPEGGSATQIDLKPLGAEAALAMAAQELRGAHLKPGRLEELVERADGNPLFLRELVEAARGGALTELPDTVEKVIAANIDTLPATDRALLRHAAVLGNKFQREWLAGMLDQPLARTMTELKRLDHFLEFDAAGMARFQHVLLRDVAYEGLPFRTRRALHGKAGNLLELSEEDPDKISGLLSIHFHAAGRFDKAWRYSVVAARRSSRQGAPVEAAHFYERALDAAPGAAVEAAERGTVAESLGDAWETAGSYEQAASAFRIARRCALGGDPTGAAAVARKLAAVHDRAGNPTLAQSWLRRGIRELADVPSGAARRERAHLMANLGEMLNVRGHHTRAIPILRAAIELAESDGPSAALAFAYRALDLTYLTLGRPAEAVFSERALAVCTSLGDTAGVARSYNTMAMAARDAGSWVRAADLWSRAEEVTDELGDRVNAAVFAANIAEIWLDQGLVGQALPALVQVRELWEQAGWKEALGWVLGRLGLAHLLVGQPAEAAACFRESVALMEEVGIKLWLTEVRVSELQMALVQRDPGATARLAALRPEVESPAMAVRVDRLTAYGLAAGDRITEAIALVGQAIQLGREQGTEFETALCLEALARFQRRLGATGQADAHDAQKQQIFDRLGVVWTPDFPLGGGPQAGLVP